MKAVLFDIGGVVVHDTGLKESVQNVFSGIDADRLWIDLNVSLLPACRGEETLANCWKNMARTYQLDIPDAQLESLWNDDFRAGVSINESVVQIIKDLQEICIVGVVSNVTDEHAVILAEIGAYEPFPQSNIVLSCDVGLTKDNAKIFSLALEKIGLPASEVVFIDDVLRYVEIARKEGLHAIQFLNAEQLKEDLITLGLSFGK